MTNKYSGFDEEIFEACYWLLNWAICVITGPILAAETYQRFQWLAPFRDCLRYPLGRAIPTPQRAASERRWHYAGECLGKRYCVELYP